MFELLGVGSGEVVIRLDDTQVSVPAGVTVAAALLYLDRLPTRRTPVSGAARAPFCMMGACFDCLVEIDGAPERACQRRVAEGMQVRRILTPVDDAE